MRSIQIINGRVITPFRVLPNARVLISGGRIAEITPVDSPINSDSIPAGDNPLAPTSDTLLIDAAGHYVSPGFIDLHVHGGGGHDFMDGTEEAFFGIAQLHARYGTTTMTPTTLSAGKPELIATLETYEKITAGFTANAAPNSSATHSASANTARPAVNFIGMHLEGPYFAMNQRGAQDPRHIRNPDPAEYRHLVSRFPSIRRWSVAPELPGALEMAAFLREKGILAAWAHTDALYDDILIAFEHGYTHATHLYSAMLGVTRRNANRYAGAVEASFLIDEMTVEIIADGIHLPPPLLKLICKIKGPDKIALITDAIRGAGMPEGETILGHKKDGLRAIIEGGVAKLPDRSAFAGSVATADRLVRNMIQLADQSLPDAVRMMTSTPATIMGVADRKGSLLPGKDADLVIFDGNINIQTTIVGGEIVYSKAQPFADRDSIKLMPS